MEIKNTLYSYSKYILPVAALIGLREEITNPRGMFHPLFKHWVVGCMDSNEWLAMNAFGKQNGESGPDYYNNLSIAIYDSNEMPEFKDFVKDHLRAY